MITLVIESIEKQKMLSFSGITFLGTADYYGEKVFQLKSGKARFSCDLNIELYLCTTKGLFSLLNISKILREH